LYSLPTRHEHERFTTAPALGGLFAKFGSAVSGRCNVRSVDATLGDVSADAFIAFPSTEIIVPNAPVGAAPAATTDQSVLVLGDFRGDKGYTRRSVTPTVTRRW